MGRKLIGAALLTAAACTNSIVLADSVDGSNSKLLTYSAALSNPTGAVFLNRFDSLVTQKNDGRVLFLENGLSAHVALDLPVATAGSQGLLDIAMGLKFSKNHYVYLYLTPSDADGGASDAAVVNRYIWNSTRVSLQFDKTILTTPKDISDKTVDGLITFDAKGHVSITPGLLAGPNVVNAKFKYSNGLTGSTKIIHPGAGSLNPSAIVLMTNSARKKGKGALTLSSSVFNANTGLSAGTLTLGGAVMPATPPQLHTIDNPAITGSGGINLHPIAPQIPSVVYSPVFTTVTPPILVNSSTVTFINPSIHLGNATLSNGTAAISNLPLTGQLQLGFGSLTSATPPTDFGQQIDSGSIVTGSGALTIVSGETGFSTGTLGFAAGTNDLIVVGSGRLNGGTVNLSVPADLTAPDPAVAGITPPAPDPDPTAAAGSLTVVSTPEPTTGLLIVSGLTGLLWRRRRIGSKRPVIR